jgi:hypothetical protein
MKRLASQREAVRLLQALFDETGDEDVEDFLQYARVMLK